MSKQHQPYESTTGHSEEQTYLLKLSDALRPLDNPVAIEETVTQLALQHFAADRCYYCRIEAGQAIIKRDALRGNLPSVAGTYPLSSFVLLKQVIDEGRPFVVHDVATTPVLDEAIRAVCLQLNVISFVNVPIIKKGEAVGILCTVQSTPRTWTAVEIQLAIETAERTWAAVERASVEEALRKSEEKYRLLSIASSDSIYTMSPEWTQIQRLIAKTFLVDTNHPNSSWLETYIPIEDQSKIQQMIQEAIDTKTIFELEHRVRRADGTVGWASSRVIPVFGEQGDIQEWLGTASDITARKQAEEDLSESEARLASIRPLTLLEQTEGLTKIGSWDYNRLTGCFTWSAGMYRLFELAPDTPIQPDIYLQVVIETDKSQAQKLVDYLLVGVGHLDSEFRIRVGEQVKTLRIKADVISEGEQQRVLGVDLDITEQLQAQAQIQETAENLQAVLDSSPAAIGLLKAVHDVQNPDFILDFKLVVGNNRLAHFFHQPLRELLGQTTAHFGPVLWEEQTLANLREVYQTHTFRYEEKLMPTPNGDRWLALTVTRQDDGVVLTGLDITELKQVQQQQQQWFVDLETSRHTVETLSELRVLLTQRQELLRTISHDLRGNFGIISGGLQLLDMADSQSERDQMMAMVLRNVNQATGLLTGLLDLARLETGQQQRTLAPMDASLLLRELGQSLQHTAQEHSLQLNVSGPPTLEVESDSHLVYRLAQNLIINALKYTHQGSVRVEWGEAGDRWWFEVVDTGPGLAQDRVKRLNINQALLEEPSAAADGAKADINWNQLRGEGIGLRIVRELANLLEARLQVSSKEGVGTRFKVDFPLRYPF